MYIWVCAGGANLNTHMFLVCSEGLELLATRVNADEGSDLLLPSVLQAHFPG